MKTTTKDYAVNMFSRKVEGVLEEQDNLKNIVENKIKTNINNSEYTLTNNKQYYLTIHSNKTIFHAEINKEYKEEITNILNELNPASHKNTTNIEYLLIVLVLFILIVNIICQWNLFLRASQKGWYVLIPIWNLYIKVKISFKSRYRILILFIPFGNMIINYKLAKAYGKNNKFAIFSIFFPNIALYIMTLDNSKYIFNN